MCNRKVVLKANMLCIVEPSIVGSLGPLLHVQTIEASIFRRLPVYSR